MSTLQPVKTDFSTPAMPTAGVSGVAAANKPRAEIDRDAVDEQGYPIYLDESDGMPLESYWHAQAMHLLMDGLFSYRGGRRDYFCGGNMFIYYSADQAKTKDYRGPDFFLVNNVTPGIRKSWVVWKENFRFPDLIVEFMSPSTEKEDLKTKLRIYEEIFTTREYVAYDPELEIFHAWRKIDGKFQPIAPDPDSRIFLEEAGLSMGTWQGAYLGVNALWVRFFHRNGGVVLFNDEVANLRADMEAKRAEMAVQLLESETKRALAEAARANAEAHRADAEASRADAEAKLAASEKARADLLAAEIARLKATLQK